MADQVATNQRPKGVLKQVAELTETIDRAAGVIRRLRDTAIQLEDGIDELVQIRAALLNDARRYTDVERQRVEELSRVVLYGDWRQR